MIRLLILLTTLFLAISCENQISSNKSKAPKQVATENPIIELEVELIPKLDTMKVLKKLVYCGIVKVDLTLDFKVIRVINGNYKDNHIPINILCPLESIESKSIRNNKKYTFKLQRRKMITNSNTSEMIYTSDFKIIPSTD